MSVRLDLSLSNLDQLDLGVVDEMFKEALNYVGYDIRQRPREEKEREITIKFRFKPDVKSKDESEVLVEAEVSAKSPSFRSRTYRMDVEYDKAERTHKIKFNNNTPDGSADMFERNRPQQMEE